jgi:hypothetical protein
MSRATNVRPLLRQVPLSSVWPPLPGQCYCTMSAGQWDDTLSAAADAGFVLLEVIDEPETDPGFVIVAAYRLDPSRN